MVDSPGSNAYTDVNTLLEEHARRRGAKIFVESPDQGARITFGEFEALSRRFANFLGAEGVRPGDRVSVLAENSIEALIVFWGTLRAGVIVNPINVEIREKHVGRILDDVAPRLVFFGRELAGDVRATWADKVASIPFGTRDADLPADDLFVRLEPADWNAVLQTNLGGTYNFCRAAAYTMMKQRRGRIINVSSVAAEYVNMGQTNYAASKGAINSFTRALAVELASRNVTVNAIAPGFIETDMSEAVRNKAGDLIKKFIPMRRVGQPDDVARVAVFLASADSAYVTGQVLSVSGGLTMVG